MKIDKLLDEIIDRADTLEEALREVRELEYIGRKPHGVIDPIHVHGYFVKPHWRKRRSRNKIKRTVTLRLVPKRRTA